MSMVRCRSQPPTASILSSSSAWRAPSFSVVGVGIGPAGQHLFVVGEQRDRFAGTVHDVAANVLVGVQVRLLFEVADGESRREAGVSGEAVIDPGP